MRLRWLLWLAPILVVLAVGSVYWGSEKNLRIQSDNFVVWGNPAVNDPGASSALLGRFYNSRTEYRPVVRPLPTLIHRWERGSFHQDRSGFQTVQLGFHVLAAILFCFLLFSTLGSPVAALLGGLIFAVHPAFTESVLRLEGLSEILALNFLLLCFLLARRAVGRTDSNLSQAWPALIGSVILFLLSALSKETAFLALPVIWVWLFARRNDGTAHGDTGARSGGEKRFSTETLLGLGILAAAILVILFRVYSISLLPEHVRSTPVVSPDSGEPLLHRFILGLAAIPAYLRLGFLPIKLAYTYDFNHGLSGGALLYRVAIGGSVLVGLIWSMVWSVRQRRSTWAFYLAWIFLFLVGGLGVGWTIGDYVAPRLLYFIGPGLIGAFLLAYRAVRNRWGAPIWDITGLVVALTVIALFGVRTANRTADYQDRRTLIQAQLAAHPGSAQAYFDNGNEYLTKGMWLPARRKYEKALEIREDFWMAWVNLGAAYFGEQEPGLASRSYERAIQGTKDRPEFAFTRAKAAYNKALIMMQQNRNTEAAELLLATIQVFPDHLRAHANLGFIYSNSPAYHEEALDHLNRAIVLERNPKNRAKLQNRVARIKEGLSREETRLRRQQESGIGTPENPASNP